MHAYRKVGVSWLDCAPIVDSDVIFNTQPRQLRHFAYVPQIHELRKLVCTWQCGMQRHMQRLSEPTAQAVGVQI